MSEVKLFLLVPRDPCSIAVTKGSEHLNSISSDFRHVIIVMTTNAGANELEKNTVGFAEQNRDSDSLHVINQLFSPEFRNRLDGIVQFNHLEHKTILRVVDKFIKQVTKQLDGKGIELIVSAEAKEWLAKKGYDRKMGARPMSRVIREYIKKPLAEQLLFGSLLHRSSVICVELVKDKLKVGLKEAVSA